MFLSKSLVTLVSNNRIHEGLADLEHRKKRDHYDCTLVSVTYRVYHFLYEGRVSVEVSRITRHFETF